MIGVRIIILFNVLMFLALSAHADWRDVANGLPIYEHGYCDQPYVVTLEDGAWLCVFTTNSGHEGTSSKYAVATRSTDRARSVHRCSIDTHLQIRPW